MSSPLPNPRNDTATRSYRSLFKATGLFGGVQLVTILTALAKSKLVAMWLGASGLGVMSLFNTAIGLISSVSNLGLQSSAVRDIARCQAEDKQKLPALVNALTRWVVATGLLGGLATIALAPCLSQWLFHNHLYTGSFVWLSVVVLLMALYNHHYAMMQGTRALGLLAKANVIGALIALACSMPLLYFFREQGIVAALILSAVATLLVSTLFRRKLSVPLEKQPVRVSFHLGLNTVKLGSMMAVSNVAVCLVEFVVKAYLAKHGTPSHYDDVGLYQAGWAINATYLGMVFTAMSKDFFPRLSQVADNRVQAKQMMVQQAEIAVLVLCPLILFLLLFLPFFVRLLYTSEFLPMVSMTRWLLVGSLIKSASFPISYLFLARNDGKLFLFNELGIKCITLPSYLLAYSLWGLQGIGLAYMSNYSIYLLWVSLVAWKHYRFSYTASFWRVFLLLLSLSLLSAVCLQLSDRALLTSFWAQGVALSLLLVVAVYSLWKLNRRMELLNLLRKRSEKRG